MAHHSFYIDLNMVRAGVVTHPSEWKFAGFSERTPYRKSALIAHDRLMELTGCSSYESFLKLHDKRLNYSLEKKAMMRDCRWTESIAVGGECFVKELKAQLGGRASGRQAREIS